MDRFLFGPFVILLAPPPSLVVFWFAFVSVLCISSSRDCTGATIIVDGDPIGSDSSTTDNTGGFAAVQQGSDNLGQPAIGVSLTGNHFLTELRVVLWGRPNNGNLLFDQFDYRVPFWKSADYFEGSDPEFTVDLDMPVGVQLISEGPTTVVPEISFGNAGDSFNNASTYDFHFDLTDLPPGGPAQNILKAPLEEGDWILAFQSWHSTELYGTILVSGSSATDGPLNLFSRDDGFPRGIIPIRWGMSLAAEVVIPGDFTRDDEVNRDDLVQWVTTSDIDDGADADFDEDSDGNDFLLWQRNFSVGITLLPGDFDLDQDVDRDDLDRWASSYGVDQGSDADDDGDSDGNDFLHWQRNFQSVPNVASWMAVPEPGSVLLMLVGMVLLRSRSGRGMCREVRFSRFPG